MTSQLDIQQVGVWGPETSSGCFFLTVSLIIKGVLLVLLGPPLGDSNRAGPHSWNTDAFWLLTPI